MIRELELKNFQCHENLSVSFSPGLNLIVGNPWAGKSTLLRAILFSLGGPTFIPGGSEVVKKLGSDSGFLVRLMAEFDGVPHTITRTMTSAKLHTRNEEVASGREAVSKEIEKRLKVGFRDIVSILYSQQESGISLLKYVDVRLSTLLEELTRSQFIENVIKKTSKRLTYFSALATPEAMEYSPEADIQELNSIYSELIAETDIATKAKAALENLELRLAAKNAMRKDLLIKLEAKANSTQVISELKGKISALLEESERLNDTILNIDPSRLFDLTNQVESLGRTLTKKRIVQREEEIKKYNISKHTSELEAINAKLNKLALPAEVTETDMKEAMESLSKISSAIAVLETKRCTHISILSGDVCPTCERQIENLLKHATMEKVQHIDIEVKHLKGKEIEARENVARLASNGVEYQRIKSERLHLEQRVATVLATIAKDSKGLSKGDSSAEISSLEEKLKDLQLQLFAEQEKKTANDARIFRKEENNLELARLKAEMKKAIATSDSAVSALDLRNISEEIEEVEANLSKERTDGQIALDRSRELGGRYRELYQIYTDKVAAKDSAHAAKETALNHSELLKVIETTKTKFFESLWEIMLSSARDFIYPASGGEITSIGRHPNGGFVFTHKGTTFPIELASGAQVNLLSIAVRLALNSVINPGLNTLLLDEPTASCPDYLSYQIMQGLKNVGKQVIAVTHRNADALAADNVITINPVSFD